MAFLSHRRKAWKVISGGGAVTYLINQNFEGTGYDNGESWTESSGTPDEDYTTSPIVGSQSLSLDSTGAVTQRTDSPSFTASADVWVYFRFRCTALPASGNRSVVIFRNSTTGIVTVQLNSSGAFRMASGVNTTPTTATISAGTDVHVWSHYTAGTGANSVISVAWSTDGIRPTSGNNFSGRTDNTGTANCDNIRLEADSLAAVQWVFDRVLVNNTTIGDNP